MTENECPRCDGSGTVHISCCDDDISGSIGETDICPTCLEHCGDEGEDCSECGGLGVLSEDGIKVYYN